MIGCPVCDHLACVCSVRAGHVENCKFRIAAAGAVGIECDHGRDVCPICDPCTCPPEPAAPTREHSWLKPGELPNTSKWTCCALCGTVQRTDGKPQSNCRGMVRVMLRGPGPALADLRLLSGLTGGLSEPIEIPVVEQAPQLPSVSSPGARNRAERRAAQRGHKPL